MTKSYYMPQHLDAPFTILIWTVDEFCLFSSLFFVSLIFFDAVMFGTILASAAVLLLKKCKGQHDHSIILHLIYWHLPLVLRLRALPPSHRRHFIG